MTTELEQEFFSVFGIEKQNEIIYTDIFGKEISKEKFKTYPNITAEKLLEMICIYIMNFRIIAITFLFLQI